MKTGMTLGPQMFYLVEELMTQMFYHTIFDKRGAIYYDDLLKN